MKKLIALPLVMAAAALAAPALAQAEKKTELVKLGESVDTLQIRYNFDAGWVVDNRNLLYRDHHDDHYLVTLKQACGQLDVRGRSFKFFPSWSWQLTSERAYEVRPRAGQPCEIGRVEQVDDAKADTLRAAAQWRIW